MKPTHPLHGLVAATHTPFKPDGSLNLALVEQQAAHLLQNSVTLAFIGGTTGEAHSPALDERRALAQRWCEVARGTALKVSVHVGSNCLADARALAAQAEQLGELETLGCETRTFRASTSWNRGAVAFLRHIHITTGRSLLFTVDRTVSVCQG